MNALPCYADLAVRQHADERGRQVAEEERLNERAGQLADEMWQDMEHLSDALDDAVGKVGYYRKDRGNHPLASRVLVLLRDGADDVELARTLRKAARDYIDMLAMDRATEEFADEEDRARQDRAESRWEDRS
jgi:hypothetical protein